MEREESFNLRSTPKTVIYALILLCFSLYAIFHLGEWNHSTSYPSFLHRSEEMARIITSKLSQTSMQHQQDKQHQDQLQNLLEQHRLKLSGVKQELPKETGEKPVDQISKINGPLEKGDFLGPKFKNFKKILYWNEVFGAKDFWLGLGQEPFIEAGCRVTECYATHDRRLLPAERADAIMWHLRSNDKSLPEVRSPHTFYIFWMLESAQYTYADLNTYNGVFNWTMTYRLDSDFPRPYGSIVFSPNVSAKTTAPKNYAHGKTKLAAWFVSNCHTVSGREHLVQALQTHMEVDIYGTCGTLICERKDEKSCREMLEKDYKFYLAFENSLCVDYITEKFFEAIKYNVVPVVYGLGYERTQIPKGAYIDVMDFASVQDLASYLLYLDSNDTAYNEYFRWKEEGYKVFEDQNEVYKKTFCDVCERLHEAEGGTVVDVNSNEGVHLNKSRLQIQRPEIKEKYRKVYNINEWFVTGQCISPNNNERLTSFVHGMCIAATRWNSSRIL
ncbi:alpha-(1,3)-fucosyltransferase C [Hyalella azteca]|uniref:Fucosyltransferase n=1 Tax=Hyalella azteca TaxID=294128 RepID=A0A979FT27_HYAAZ|nr:alpha-(1,3)-fucosyltransferase C [Hyalella azteca]